MTPRALRALDITGDADVPSQNRLERDAAGNPTGAITGNMIELFE